MCDIYISEIGYICNDCKSNFERYYLNYKNSNIKKALISFMNKELRPLSYEEKQKRSKKFEELFKDEQ